MKLVVLGAGKIGRGFLAQLFNSAGWNIVFIDESSKLVEMLNRTPSYPVYLAGSKGDMQRLTVKGYRALHNCQSGEIQKELQSSDLAAVAVPVADIESAVKVLCPALLQRLARSSPFNLVICANMAGAAEKVRAVFLKSSEALGLKPEELHEIKGRLGIVDSIVIRMAPQTPPELLEENPLAVLTNDYPELFLNRKAYLGAFPDVPGVTAIEQFHDQEVRKFYTYNTVHAVLGFLGRLRGHSLVADCFKDRWLRDAVEEALDESSVGLMGEFGFQEEDMFRWNKRLMEDVKNPYLGDQLKRLVKNPEEKLARNERLVGPALLALKHGRAPKSLSLAIASALTVLQAGAAGMYRFCGLTEQDRDLVKEITQAGIRLKEEQQSLNQGLRDD
jgi:mannitol-1-phosphate 5-dehydrogenase